MSTVIKMVTLLLFLNIFIYIGVNFGQTAEADAQFNQDLKFHWKGDLIDTWLSDSNHLDDLTLNVRDNWTDYDVGFNSNLATSPEQLGGSFIGDGGIILLDALKIAYKIIPTLFNIAVSPLTLFFNFRLPVFIGLMIGIPYMIILILTIYLTFIRGAGD